MGIYVDHLVEEGYLFEGKAAARDFGRPPTILALNPQAGRFIGVDFEARNIMAVAVDFSQRQLKQVHDTIAVAEPVENILHKIEHAIEAAATGDDRKVLGIGVGVPGVIDPTKGVALSYKHIKGWEKVPLVSRLTERFGVPVFVENTIRTMALAELWFGQGRGLRNFICLGARSGLGAGIIRVVQKRLADATRTGLDATAALRTEVPVEALVQAALAGNEVVLGFLDQVAHTFAQVLNQLNCAFNPQKIILAGAFTVFGDVFLRRLQECLNSFAPPSGAPLVVNTQLGPFNGAIGAAALAVHEWKPLPC